MMKIVSVVCAAAPVKGLQMYGQPQPQQKGVTLCVEGVPIQQQNPRLQSHSQAQAVQPQVHPVQQQHYQTMQLQQQMQNQQYLQQQQQHAIALQQQQRQQQLQQQQLQQQQMQQQQQHQQAQARAAEQALAQAQLQRGLQIQQTMPQQIPQSQGEIKDVMQKKLKEYDYYQRVIWKSQQEGKLVKPGMVEQVRLLAQEINMLNHQLS